MRDKLYPITYQGKKYLEKDCDEIFTAYYTSIHSLRYDGSVYVGDGISITPDGEWV